MLLFPLHFYFCAAGGFLLFIKLNICYCLEFTVPVIAKVTMKMINFEQNEPRQEKKEKQNKTK